MDFFQQQPQKKPYLQRTWYIPESIIDLACRFGRPKHLNSRYCEGSHFLEIALLQESELGREKSVLALISAGADVNFTSFQRGWCRPDSAISLATENGHNEVVDILIAAGAKDLDEALLQASKLGRQKIVLALISAGADVNFTKSTFLGETALLLASENGHKEVVDILIAAGAKVHRQLLPYACNYGWTNLVYQILSATDDANYTNDKILVSVASEQGHMEIWLALVQAAANEDSYGTVVNTVASSERVEELYQIAGSRAKEKKRKKNDDDDDDDEGACLAYSLASKERRNIVFKTLQENHDNVKDPVTARRKIYQSIVEAIIFTGTKKDIDVALLLASKAGLDKMIDLLISHKADLKYTLDNGMSAMQLALRKVVKKMLMQRAKIDSLNMFCEVILEVYGRYGQHGSNLLDKLFSAESKICQADKVSLQKLVQNLADYAIKITTICQNPQCLCQLFILLLYHLLLEIITAKQELKKFTTLTFKMTGSNQIILLRCQDVEQHPGPFSAEMDATCRSLISESFLFYWNVKTRKEFTAFIKASDERSHMNVQCLYADQNKPNNWNPVHSFDDPSNPKKQSSMTPCDKTSMLLGILICCNTEDKIPTKSTLDKLEAFINRNDSQLKSLKRKNALDDALLQIFLKTNPDNFQQILSQCLQPFGLQVQRNNDLISSGQHDGEVTEDRKIRKERLKTILQELTSLTQTLEDEIGKNRPGRKRRAPDSNDVIETIFELEKIYIKKTKSGNEPGN